MEPGSDAGAATTPDRRGSTPPLLTGPWRVVDTVLSTVMVVLTVLLIGALGWNVFGRYVLNTSLAAADELARFLFIWLVFTGAALAHLHGEHIKVDYLVEKASPRVRWALGLLREVAIVTFIVFLLIGAQRVLATTTGEAALTKIPFVVFNLSLPSMAALMGLISLRRVGALIRRRPDLDEKVGT